MTDTLLGNYVVLLWLRRGLMRGVVLMRPAHRSRITYLNQLWARLTAIRTHTRHV